MSLNEDELRDLYKWVDAIPLSKPKKNINRDFSDGGKLKLKKKYRNLKFINKALHLLVKFLNLQAYFITTTYTLIATLQQRRKELLTEMLRLNNTCHVTANSYQ